MSSGQKPPGSHCPGWTPGEGELLEDPNRLIADMLGSNYAGGLIGKAKDATWSQLCMHAGWGWPGYPGIPIPDSIFTTAEILSIVECIEKKTGRTYYKPRLAGQYGPGCGSCSCIP